MDNYLTRLRNEQPKKVRFQIVEDNARLHSSIEIDRWASTDRRHSLRRHHSQPTLRRRGENQESKEIARWSSESSHGATPIKIPRRKLSVGGDRWRVCRNNSDSMIHSPPKRRYTSPNSPMLMISSLKKAADKDLPPRPPLQTNEVIVDPQALEVQTAVRTVDEVFEELKTEDIEQPQDYSTATESDCSGGSWNQNENDEIVPLVQTRQVPSSQQSQRQDDESTILKSLFGLLDIMLLWSIWNAISRSISHVMSRCRKGNKKALQKPNDKRKLERLEQGEAIPLVMHQRPHTTSPSSFSPSTSRW